MSIPKMMLEALKEWLRDRATAFAAALAYNALFAIGPLVAFIIFISSKILGVSKTHSEIVPLLENWFTPQFVNVVNFLLKSEKHIEPTEIYSISLLLAFFLGYGTKEYFSQIKLVVNATWNVRRYVANPKFFLKRTIKDIIITIVVLAIMIFFFFIRAILPHPYIDLDAHISKDAPYWVHIFRILFQFILIFCVTLFYFSFIPPVKVILRNAIPGALLASILYVIGRESMHVHMSHHPEAGLGESMIAVLLWFYYSGLVFIYAAEFSKVYISNKQDIDVQSLKIDV